MSEDFISRPGLSAVAAMRLIAAAKAHAESTNLAVAVAVSDAAGNAIATARMDDAPLGALRLANDKAYTAALWQMPSGDLSASSQPGGADWGLTSTEGGRIVVYGGGLPIFCAGTLAGAIGVSGGTSDQDTQCANAALEATLPDDRR